MPIRRILVLQSVEDSVTQHRKLRMEQSPFLRDYKFDHCYAFELTKKQKASVTFEMIEQVKRALLDETDLIKRLEKEIRKFEPDALIVHYGFVFRRFPSEMSSALVIIKSKFPNLRIGIEEREPIASELKLILDSSNEIRSIITEIF